MPLAGEAPVGLGEAFFFPFNPFGLPYPCACFLGLYLLPPGLKMAAPPPDFTLSNANKDRKPCLR